MKKEIITVAGSLGSGKTTTAKALAEALGFKHFSSGDIFRKLATERGVSVEAINLAAEVQQNIDRELDDLLKRMGEEDDKFVVDSRMAWHWMPGAFKVFLFLDPAVAAQRIFADIEAGKRISEYGSTVEEVRASIDRRFASEQKRYFNLYGVDPTDPANHDLVIDTKDNDLEHVVAIVLAAYGAWRKEA